MAPADGKHLDAILKLIQKPIDYLETGKAAAQPAATDDGEDKPARPARSRRGGPRTRAEAEAQTAAEPKPEAKPRAAKPTPAAGEAAETAKPERSQRPSRSRGKPRPDSEKTDSDSDTGSSPFGNDGPIPAFLLRPTRAAS